MLLAAALLATTGFICPLGSSTAHATPAHARADLSLQHSGTLFAAPPEVKRLAHGGGNDGGTGWNGGGGGGGGGGDDDDSSEFLRLLNSAEQASVLEDWTMRSRIYKMTDDAKLKEAHMAHIAELETLVEFDTSQSGTSGRRMVLGLFRHDEVRAVAGAEVSHAAGLVVNNLLVYPAELNDEDSTTTLRMMHALHLLADAIETPLNLSPLRESGCVDALTTEGVIDDE